MLTRADMKELGSTDNNSDDGEYDAKRDAALSYDAAIAEMRRRKEWREKLTAAKRVEFIGNCMMIQGDCLEVMPQIGKVDAVVTDPPYGIGADEAASKNNGKWGWKFYGDSKWDRARPPQAVFDEILKFSSETIIWGGNYFTDMLPPSMGWLVWDKGQREFSLADVELAWTSRDKAARAMTFSRSKALLDGKEHPTQKPIEVMRWCLGFLPGAKTILDPFMGSGTTGVACVKTGRHFIGIELDPDYFEIACRRVREAYAQPDLLIDAPKEAPQVQEAMEL
jgi:DNA modification methylase